MNWKEKINQFQKVFPEIGRDLIKQLFESGDPINIKSGEYLFHQDEESHEMYILLSGRLRAIHESAHEKKILGDIGPGETVGELAFFSDDKRMASVLAIRDSKLLVFSPDRYMVLMAKNPELAQSLFKLVVNRLRRNSFESNRSSPPKNIAFIKLDPNLKMDGVLHQMSVYMAELGIELKSFDSKVLEKQNKDDFFIFLEENDALNILVADSRDPEWARQCKVYADLNIVLTAFEGRRELTQIEKELDLYGDNILNKNSYLLLMHEEDHEISEGTRAWLEERAVDMHIHMRPNKKEDIQRFCRILTHNAVGLVLGGGGAKGFAHIGVVKALQEKKIPIDFLGGTSAGALYGIGMSFLDFNMKEIHEKNEEGVKRNMTSGELTLPVFSLKKGKKFRNYLQYLFADYNLEDIWINSYCVSTNYSTAENTVHHRGKIWQKVLASMSIPGIFPPVVIDQQLHVDGGVMDNVPIEAMYKFPVNRIIAISLNSGHRKKVDFQHFPGSYEVLKNRLLGKKKYSVPGILSIITNSLIINSKQKEMEYKDQVSDYIALDLKGVGLLDDKQWEKSIQKGYEQTIAYLEKKG